MRPDRVPGDSLVKEFVERVTGGTDAPPARQLYREGFRKLRSALEMYPAPGRRASVVFESAARTARRLAADCLPLGIGVAMHLYPLCALQCMPLPSLSLVGFRRALLLRTIRNRSLILANAGGERTRGASPLLIARPEAGGIRIDGRFEYMSLASVADIVLFKARLANLDRTVLCAADLRGDSVHIGDWKFSGSMQLSDTSSVTFSGHRVPRGRYIVLADDDALTCTSDYQRCWFHLFLTDLYLARLERLHLVWDLPRSTEQVVILDELAQLRDYALRLLDDASSGSDVRPLKRLTSTMKLRVSRMAQSTVLSLRNRDGSSADAGQLKADADELGYIQSQPTADEIILRNIGAFPGPEESI